MTSEADVMEPIKRLQKQQSIERKALSRIVSALQDELEKEEVLEIELKTLLALLSERSGTLAELDERFRGLLLDAPESAEIDVDRECEAMDDFSRKIVHAKLRAEGLLFTRPNSPVHSLGGSETSSRRKKTVRLPKIEMRKFGGELTEWLGWWAQFSRIDEDEELHDADKFSYLLQSMVKGSRAEEAVKRYPESAANYPKAIAALKERFGKRKLLKQVYVRELIKMILDTRSKDKTPLSTLYDRLQSSLHSLASLGVNMEQMVEFLFPMVESSLPEDILLAWQRSANFGKDGSDLDPPRSEIDFLMDFLRVEIENEEQRKLARSGFGVTDKPKKQQGRAKDTSEDDLPTAAGLFSGHQEGQRKLQCIFCAKAGHESRDCFKAQKMTLEEKTTIIQKGRACFKCLKIGHTSSKCKATVTCPVCEKKHYPVMCPEVTSKKGGAAVDKESSVHVHLNCTNEVLLRTLMVEVSDPVTLKKKVVRALIDCGSQKSYVLEKTVRELRSTPMDRVKVNHQLFGGSEVKGQYHSTYKLRIGNLRGKFSFDVTLMDQPQICGVLPRAPQGNWMQELKTIGIKVNDLDSSLPAEISVLIGADYLGSILTGKSTQLENGLTATQTRLGWTLMGIMKEREHTVSSALSVVSMTLTSATVAELWKLETLGISDPIEVKSQEEKDRAAHLHFMDTVKRSEEGRYTVSLPWTEGVKALPSNYAVAKKRLEATTKKLNGQGHFEKYDAVFREWEQEGIISEVKGVLEGQGVKCHYLPHRGVIKESKTTPVRPVFDASCKVAKSPSLNQCLEKGPNLLELIPSILLRFRMGNIGVIADIRKAFLMIEVEQRDRPFMRFLWWEDSTQKRIKEFQHNRVVFGMNCSPFLLSAVISHHLNQEQYSKSEVLEIVKKSLYVDNLVTAVDTSQEVSKLREEATRVLAEAHMELRQWERSGGEDEEQVTVVLGLKWNKGEDTLYCDVLPAELTSKITKRVILSQVQRVFDPLGFLCPTLIVPKILLQQAWVENKSWDEEVSESTRREFEEWWKELMEAKGQILVPRNCAGGIKLEEGKFQIHVFCDASKRAYAATVFLRVETGSGVKVNLLQAKSRVAPLKQATIPRLELVSCAIAARLVHSVKKSLGFEQVPTFLWTDSSTALSWIRTDDEWGTFVGNRVKEIVSLTGAENWRHVPGIQNPADLPSRGISPMKLTKLRWWEGPDWLRKDRREWPSADIDVNWEEVYSERKKGISTLTVSTSGTLWYIRRNEHYANLRVMSLVFRFLDLVRKKVQRGKGSCQASPEEIKATELRLFKLVQAESFQADRAVIEGVRVEKDAGGILRVRTKLTFRKDQEGFRFPVLLPSSHPLTDMLIQEEHRQNCHAGAQFLMSRLRERVWIVHGRREIKKVIKTCVKCRRFDSKKAEVPSCALPENRVKDSSAFEVTGIDLAGPLMLKNKSKAYIVLFTCAVYRCVHLEVVDSLSTEDFLLAFVRFCKRKRRPEVVYTDNGTNFVGAVNLFKKIDWGKVEKESQQKRVKWIFNPPSAPWWGGWWERLIRSVKDLLRRMLGFGKLTLVELQTSCCEVEEVVNHRPLTFVTEDTEDLIPLTPSMFIHDLPFESVPEAELITGEGLKKKRKFMKTLLQELKDRFRSEYLGQLVQRGKERPLRTFQVGDVVLVERDNAKRIFWPMARIVELLPGKDGEVRAARVKTQNGTLLRPLQRLFPLEVDSGDMEVPTATNETEASSQEPEVEQGVVSKKQDPEPKQRVSRFGRVIKTPTKFCVY